MKRFWNVTTFSFLTRKTQCIIHVSKHMAEEQTATCGRALKVSNKFVMYWKTFVLSTLKRSNDITLEDFLFSMSRENWIRRVLTPYDAPIQMVDS